MNRDIYEPDFVRDTPGDIDTGSARVVVNEPDQVVNDDSMGELDYDTKPPTPAQKTLRLIAKAFTPQPIPVDDESFMTTGYGGDVAKQLEDALRFIKDLGIKTLDTPARRTKFYTVTITATEPVRIAGYQPSRKRLVLITTDATNEVYLGTDNNVTAAGGWILPATYPLEVLSQDDIWGICGGAENATIRVMVEHYA